MDLPTVEEMLGYRIEIRHRVHQLIGSAAMSHEKIIQQIVLEKKLKEIPTE